MRVFGEGVRRGRRRDGRRRCRSCGAGRRARTDVDGARTLEARLVEETVERVRDVLGEDNAPMQAPGASEGDGQVAFAFLLRTSAPHKKESFECSFQELLRLGQCERGEILDRLLGTRDALQLGDEVRVFEKPDVEHQVGVGWRAVLEAERQVRAPSCAQCSRMRGRRSARSGRRRSWTPSARRVDHAGGAVAQRGEPFALEGHSLEDGRCARREP